MEFFTELSLIIAVATIIAGIMRALKQPIIIGHIITGLIISPKILGIFQHAETIEVFSQIGIAILLFVVGLHLSPYLVKAVGKTALIVGSTQIIVTTILGFALATLLGFNYTSAIYIGIGLTFSSTIIVSKLLSDKDDLENLYGRISIGILLVQDVVATLTLIVIAAFSEESNAVVQGLMLLVKGVTLTIVLIGISTTILPKLSKFFASSPEFLFLFSMGWGFGMAALFNYIGFSIEIGALAAGVTLSASPYSQEISAKLKPLRDFFVIMFFILLGSNVHLGQITNTLIPILAFTLFALLIKPVIIMISLGLLNYTKKVGFFTGSSLAQISEFSLIVVMMGFQKGHIDGSLVSNLTLVGLITITLSTYMIIYDEKIYQKLAPYLKIFEKPRPQQEQDIISSYNIILFGCNRVGYDFIKKFSKLGQGFLAIDFDPEVVSRFKAQGVNCRYGDAEDVEFLNNLGMDMSQIVVSTIPDFDVNWVIINKIREKNEETLIILIAYTIENALKLYEKGATYVLLPHLIGGQYASELANRAAYDVESILQRRGDHIEYLETRQDLGHR